MASQDLPLAPRSTIDDAFGTIIAWLHYRMMSMEAAREQQNALQSNLSRSHLHTAHGIHHRVARKGPVSSHQP